MKKFILAFLLISVAYITKAQNVLLNEFYVQPPANNQEYFELHNTSFALGGENLDCYTLVTYFAANGERGFYVLDLPNIQLAPGGYFVGSSQKSFSFNDSTSLADYSWNDAAYLSTHSGSTKKYVLNSNGSGYTVQTGTFNDIFVNSNNGGNGNNGVYANFLFYQGNIVDVFLGAQNSPNLPNYIANLPNLPAGSLACSSNAVDFSTLDDNPAIVGTFPAPALDNDNYYRENNNRCGTWKKGTNPSYLTPGTRNELDHSLDIVVDATFSCDQPTFSFDVTHAPTTALPVTASLYYDINNDSTFNAGDVLVGTHVDGTLNDGAFTFNVATGASLILVVSGADLTACSNAIYYFSCPAGGPLPVGLKSFNVQKMGTGAGLVWETASEMNNRGFEILRKTSNGFESIGFVNSLAPGGTSASGYTYHFNDLARLGKGTTYYRLRQVDLDNHAFLSDIRAIRTDGVADVLILPNPSNGNPKLVLPSDAGRMDISLVDFAGRVVQRWSNVRESNLQLSNLRKGIYSLRVYFTDSQQQVVQKVLVQ